MKPEVDALATPVDAPGLAMELGVYGCAGNAVLFVPMAVQPPLEANAVHGPLVYLRTVFADPSASAAWREILKQIDRHLFATVSADQIDLLLGRGDVSEALDDQARAAI